MRRTYPRGFLVAVPFLCWLVACGGDEFTSGEGDAGSSDDAGIDSSSPGQGGADASHGGAAGKDAGPGSGGVAGSGGVVGEGGSLGEGGATNNGGAPGSGGVMSNGGAPGSGGIVSSGGAPGSGGATSKGGAPGSGGATNKGGAPGSGGAVSTGGAPGDGGSVDVLCYCGSNSPSCELRSSCTGICGEFITYRVGCDCSEACANLTQTACAQEFRCSWNIYSNSCLTMNCFDGPDCPDACTTTGACNSIKEDVYWQPAGSGQCPGN